MTKIERLVGDMSPIIVHSDDDILSAHLMFKPDANRLAVGVGMYLPPSAWANDARWERWKLKRAEIMGDAPMRIIGRVPPRLPFPYAEIDRLVNKAFAGKLVKGYAIIGDPEDTCES